MASRRFFIVAGLLLVGCIPAVVGIYKPEVPGGRLSGNACNGHAGPHEVITFDRGGISVEATAREDTDRRVRVFVTFLIPQDHIFSLRSPDFQLKEQGNEVMHFRISDLSTGSYTNQIRVPFDANMTGQTTVRGVRQYYARYWVEFVAARTLPERFVIQLPSATVNNRLVDFPEIVFTKMNDFVAMPLNC
jgi:hypothetical protein